MNPLSRRLEVDQGARFELQPGFLMSKTINARGIREGINEAREVITSIGKILPPPKEDIPDLTAFADEILDDPEVEEVISNASSEELQTIESALTQKAEALTRELQTLESAIETIINTAPDHQAQRITDLQKALEGKPLEEQAEIIFSFSHKADTEVAISQVVTTPDLANAVWRHMSVEFERACNSYQPWDQAVYKKYLSITSRSRYLEATCLDTLEGQFGKIFARKLMHPEYQTELAAFADFLLGEQIRGVRLTKEPLSLSQVIVARETFGSIERLRSLCQAFNVGQYLEDWDPEDKKEIFTFGYASFSEKGMTSNINVHFEVRKNDDYAEVDRDLVLDIQFDETQKQATNRLHVVHGTFRLPDELQNQGIAKSILHDSFTWYLEQKAHGCTVTDVSLLANVSVGGYAWAAYGFGWNKDRLILKEEDRLTKETGKKSSLTSEELWVCALQRHVKECQRRAEIFLRKVSNLSSEMRKSLMGELEAAMQDLSNPLTIDLVTPQRLASLGKTGVNFVRVQDDQEHEYWYPDIGNVQGKVMERTHLGKAMSLGLSWHGVLNLEPKTPLEQDQLSLLKKRIDL